jgi:hypothetical protein
MPAHQTAARERTIVQRLRAVGGLLGGFGLTGQAISSAVSAGTDGILGTIKFDEAGDDFVTKMIAAMKSEVV